MGFKLLIGAPQDFWVKIKEHLSEWVTNGFLEDSILRRNDEAIRYKENGTAPIYMMSLGYEWFSLYSRWMQAYRNLTINALNEKGKVQLVKYLKQLDIWKTGGFLIFHHTLRTNGKSIILSEDCG